MPVLVENPPRLGTESVMVGADATTVPVTSRYLGVAPGLAWTMVPAFSPSPARAESRTVITEETFPPLSGVMVTSPA